MMVRLAYAESISNRVGFDKFWRCRKFLTDEA